MAKAKFEQISTAAALTGVGMADPEDKTGAADLAQTGTVLPATGTAGATADAAGDDTLAADAGDLVKFADPAESGTALPAMGDEPLVADAVGIVTTATVIVKGPAKGRWRIGRHFTQEPVSIPERDLSPEQKDALASDPELTVVLVDGPY